MLCCDIYSDGDGASDQAERAGHRGRQGGDGAGKQEAGESVKKRDSGAGYGERESQDPAVDVG